MRTEINLENKKKLVNRVKNGADPTKPYFSLVKGQSENCVLLISLAIENKWENFGTIVSALFPDTHKY